MTIDLPNAQSIDLSPHPVLSFILRKSGRIIELPTPKEGNQDERDYVLKGVKPGFTLLVVPGTVESSNDVSALIDSDLVISLREHGTDVTFQGWAGTDKKRTVYRFRDENDRLAGRGWTNGDPNPYITGNSEAITLSISSSSGALDTNKHPNHSHYLILVPMVPDGIPISKPKAVPSNVQQLSAKSLYFPPLVKTPSGTWTYTSEQFMLTTESHHHFSLEPVVGPVLEAGLLVSSDDVNSLNVELTVQTADGLVVLQKVISAESPGLSARIRKTDETKSFVTIRHKLFDDWKMLPNTACGTSFIAREKKNYIISVRSIGASVPVKAKLFVSS